MEIFQPKTSRYDSMTYKRCGQSGILLPAISLGLWHNFGGVDTFENGRNIVRAAFDAGITHFDLANNYGPPPGSAEENFGLMMDKDLRPFRDELFISTKAGYHMWPGPYGDLGSRKYLISSLDQSLKRMKLDYVDLFYHHRPDPSTPIEESMRALDQIVRSGKALYVGISNYSADDTAKAAEILRSLGTPNIIHQAKYSMFERWVEPALLDTLENNGMGLIAFSPLAQGLLTDRYLDGIPEDSRAAKSWGFLQTEAVNHKIAVVKQLNAIAKQRGQSLAQMAIAWLLKDERVTSVLVGASSVAQLNNNLKALDCLAFSTQELAQIEELLTKA
jgi:L-glyceraldehyde 3-phosphate reductase